MHVCFIILSLLLTLSGSALSFTLAPCTGESADICGFLPSTYANLSLSGVPPLCNADCPVDFQVSPNAPGGWDRCGVCGGLATYSQTLLEPQDPPEGTHIGGSVASWNGTVASSQHIGQRTIADQYTAIVAAPVTTWNYNHVTGLYTLYQIPWRIGDAVGVETYLPVGRGYALIMGANHLVIGSHDTQPREVQVWTRTPNSEVPWQFAWRSPEFCSGAHFGYAVAIDENPPKDPGQGIFGTVIVGDPSAHIAGAVSVHRTNAPDIIQTIYYGGYPNQTEITCFGQSVSADGGYLAIGAPAYKYGSTIHAGTVYIYQWNPSAGFTGLYEYRTQIVAPTPVTNGGFGESVSVWNDELLVGDNQHTIYKYKLIGVIAVPIGINNPTGLSADSRLGYTVSLWQDYAAAGDNTYVVSATQQGATFVWDRNPLDLNSHRGPRYMLFDEGLGNFNTHYGTYVDLRGGNGCFIASGTVAEDTAGGVWVVNLCRDDCYGCDSVLNSCVDFDNCEVCGGDNTTCIDCNGVLNGPAVLDDCGVCEGNNSTCINPSASPSAIVTPCETMFNVTLIYPYGNQHGPATWTLTTPLPTKGSVLITPVSNTQAHLSYTPYPYESGLENIYLVVQVPSLGINDTLTIPVTIGSCIDCYGVPNGPDRPDQCGVCAGDNSTCAGCDGIPNSGAVLDFCGVCAGDNSTCVDILLEPFYSVPCYAQIVFQLLHEPASTPVFWEIVTPPTQGTLGLNSASGFVIYMNPVVMGTDYFVVKVTSLLNSSVFDIQNVTLDIEDCFDCDNSTLGIQILDACGVCNGNGATCSGCDGVPNSNNTLDLCGVCRGNNTCLDCFGLPFGNSTYADDGTGNQICCSIYVDLCGVCGGDNDCAAGKGVTASVFIWAAPIFILLMLLVCNFHNQWHYGHWYWYNRVKEGHSQKWVDDTLREGFTDSMAPSYGDEQRRADERRVRRRAKRERNNQMDKNWGTWDTLNEADQSARNTEQLKKFATNEPDGGEEFSLKL